MVFHVMVFLIPEGLHLQRSLSAISIVVAPHGGDNSFSIDLRTDEIPSTGGHRFFAHYGRNDNVDEWDYS